MISEQLRKTLEKLEFNVSKQQIAKFNKNARLGDVNIYYQGKDITEIAIELKT